MFFSIFLIFFTFYAISNIKKKKKNWCKNFFFLEKHLFYAIFNITIFFDILKSGPSLTG